MTLLGLHLGSLALQVTLLSLFAVLLTLTLVRRDPRSTVVLLSASLVALLGITLASVCPMPAAWCWSPLPPATPADASMVRPETTPDAAADQPGGSVSLAELQAWLTRIGRQPRQASGGSKIVSWIVTAYVLGVVVAGVRLLLGWLALKRLRRHSQPIAATDTLQLLDLVRCSLGVTRPIELRQCAEPGLAATVGWRRPVIYLPPEWTSWTSAEQRAVLAHETSHIRHGDYLLGLLASLCRALHFYHPLVRWLSARLRWEQEVAADALAATVAGGRTLYLQTLARLALGAPARTPAGALAWSPVCGASLLGRIRMLQRTEKRCLSRIVCGSLVALVAAAACLVATAAWPEPVAGAEEPLELGYLPADTRGFIAIRPALCMRQPGMREYSAMLDGGIQTLKAMGVTLPAALRPENVEQMVADLRLSSAGTGEPNSRSLQMGTSSLVIRMNQDFDWLGAIRSLVKDLRPIVGKDKAGRELALEEQRDGDVTVYSLGPVPILGPGSIYFDLPDRRTIVFQSSLRRATPAADYRKLKRNVEAARQRNWGTGIAASPDAAITVVLDNRGGHYADMLAKDLADHYLADLRRIDFATLGIELGDKRPVRTVVDAVSAEAGTKLEASAKALLTIAQASARDLVKAEAAAWDALQEDLMIDLTRSAELGRKDARLELRGYSTLRIRDYASAYVSTMTEESPPAAEKSK